MEQGGTLLAEVVGDRKDVGVRVLVPATSRTSYEFLSGETDHKTTSGHVC